MSTLRHCLRRQTLVLAIAVSLGAACAAQAAAPQFATVAQATTLSRGDVITGAASLSQPVHVSVSLKLRDKAGMDAFLARAHQPSTPASQRVMSKSQLANHLPTQAQAQAVADYLTQAGFVNVKIHANRLLVSADGHAAVAQPAFSTSLAKVRTHDGRSAFANNSPVRIPAALQATVQAVVGLQNVHQMHTMVRPQVVGTGATVKGHYPTEFASLYNADGLAPATDIQVGIITAGDVSQTVLDLNTFTTNNSLTPVNLNVVCVNSTATDNTCGQTDDSGVVEWNLDTQDIVGIGGVTNITLYDSPSLQNDQLTDTIAAIVNDNTARVINVSLGECERFTDADQGGDGSGQADDALFATAVAQGQTFSVSTGDSGSDECGDGKLNSASSPASSPYVVAAGGTQLTTGRQNQYFTETSWNGGGGSPSSFEPAPQWQINSGVLGSSTKRGLPDIAFDADPSSGSIIYINGSTTSGGRPNQIGGTSLAAPLFTGAWARILQNSGDLGFAAPYLYNGSLSSAAFHDVVRGSNGGYRAKVGWDYTTGWGSLNVGKAAADLSTPE